MQTLGLQWKIYLTTFISQLPLNSLYLFLFFLLPATEDVGATCTICCNAISSLSVIFLFRSGPLLRGVAFRLRDDPVELGKREEDDGRELLRLTVVCVQVGACAGEGDDGRLCTSSVVECAVEVGKREDDGRELLRLAGVCVQVGACAGEGDDGRRLSVDDVACTAVQSVDGLEARDLVGGSSFISATRAAYRAFSSSACLVGLYCGHSLFVRMCPGWPHAPQHLRLRGLEKRSNQPYRLWRSAVMACCH
jgi:hypothetical protein